MTEMTEVNRPPPLFFLSYAHSSSGDSNAAPRERNRQVLKFFNDLSENVAWLVSRSPGSDPGFMDRSIGYGSRWTPELLQVIGTCQVFIALLSDPYIKSSWCGKEWYAFSQRKVIAQREVEHQSAIIPVIWAPFPDELTPAAIHDVQRFSPSGLAHVDIVAKYEQNGILGLMQMRNASYRGIVWRLAQCVAGFHYSHRVEPRTLGPDELHDIFQEYRP